MEEEFFKRNTDCVYFLASPFTCKKGVECEYRHSEMARLNPRDCWYWASRKCFNPACAFRHPPMDVHNEALTEAALTNQSCVTATKTTVPCYFYYNGFCNKGIRCPFLHEPSEPFVGDPKTTVANTPVIPLGNNTLGGVDAHHIPAENPSAPSETAMAPSNKLQGSKPNSSGQIHITQCEEIPTSKMVSVHPPEGSIKSEGEPSLDSNQSFEELTDGNIVRDEWESSPGFDVLVDGRTEEDMVCEDDPEYLHALNGNDGDSERLYIPRGFACQTEHDERGFFDNNGLYESLQDELSIDLQEYPIRRTRDRNARHVARKRNFVCMDGTRHNVDLRDYLRKRRMVDGTLETHDLRNELVHVRDNRREERYRRYGSTRRVHGRLASKVERNGVQLSRRRASVNDLEHRGRHSYSQHNGVRQYSGRQSRKQSSYPKRERYIQGPTTFSKPKSLAEIREGKRVGHFNKYVSADFEGPKPLSEILKDKSKTISSPDGFASGGN